MASDDFFTDQGVHVSMNHMHMVTMAMDHMFQWQWCQPELHDAKTHLYLVNGNIIHIFG